MTKIIGALLLIMTVSVNTSTSHAGLRPKFEITIDLAKKEYTVGESLKGEVRIINKFMAAIPATFTMIMTHDSRQKHSSQLNAESFPPGRMSFSFRSFRIPETPFKEEDIGEWEIIINKLDYKPEHASVVTFEVKK